MSSFTVPLVVEVEQGETQGRGLARLVKSFTYEVGWLGSGHRIIVPEGFETDFCSIPRWAMPFFPVLGKAAKAAVIHDWLVNGPYPHPWGLSADIFCEAMAVLKVPRYRRWPMWLGVKFHGWLQGKK